MHGGAAGSGGPKGNQDALKLGQYTKNAIEERRELRRLIPEAGKFLENIAGSTAISANNLNATIEAEIWYILLAVQERA